MTKPPADEVHELRHTVRSLGPMTRAEEEAKAQIWGGPVEWDELFNDGMAGLTFARNGSKGVRAEMYIAGGHDEADRTAGLSLTAAQAASLRDWLVANV